MISLALVDDDNNSSQIIKNYISRYEEENKNVKFKISVFVNAEAFLASYKKEFAIVLMDIEMPGINGFEATKKLRKIDEDVILIFVTNMAQYAIKGYEVDALDFVVKPVSYFDFSLKMTKAIRALAKKANKDLVLLSSNGIENVKISEVYYIEVLKHYLIYHTVNGNIKCRGVFKDTEKELSNYGFAKCSRPYLINLKHVKSVRGNVLKVSGDQIVISRNEKTSFMEALTQYLGGFKE